MVIQGATKLKELNDKMGKFQTKILDNGIQNSKRVRKSVRRRKRRIIRDSKDMELSKRSYMSDISEVNNDQRKTSKKRNHDKSMKHRLKRSPFRILKKRLYSAKSRR